MTLTLAEIQEEVAVMARNHGVPSQEKLDRFLPRLERMRNFYEEKANSPDCPVKQANMFTGFANALAYSIAIIHKHRKLTTKLAGIVADDDTIEA